MRDVGAKILKGEFDERVEFVKILARAAAAGGVRL